VSVTYQVKSSKDLHERWQMLVNHFSLRSTDLRAIIQNDIELSSEELMQWKDRAMKAKAEFDTTFNELVQDTVMHIAKG